MSVSPAVISHLCGRSVLPVFGDSYLPPLVLSSATWYSFCQSPLLLCHLPAVFKSYLIPCLFFFLCVSKSLENAKLFSNRK